jgi:Predicted membrane protein (DUF2079)
VASIVEERSSLGGAPGSDETTGEASQPESTRPPLDPPLQRVRRIGFMILGVQAVGLLIWSVVMYHRFAVSSDFAGYDQAWYLMAHGHLNPRITVWGNHVFLKSHAEVIMDLLAPLWWISHSGLTLLWLADIALVVAECVTFAWMCEVAASRPSRTAWKLAALGLFFLVANPWMYWALSFDFHAETLGACLALLAAYDLAHHRNRAWVWLALCLCCGDVCSTYIAGVGISAVLAGKAWRRQGLVFIGLGAAFTGLVTVFGANSGSGLASYAPPTGGSGGTGAAHTGAAHSATHVHGSGVSGVSGLLASPFRAPAKFFHDLWPNKLNIYANLAPAGGIGIFCAWGFGVPFIVLLENNLRAGFSVTAAQNLPIFCFVSLGTVMVLSRISAWKPVVAAVVAVVLALSTLGWFIEWFPRTAPQWLRANATAAAAIARAEPSISPGDEVAAAHGIEGPLSGRANMYSLSYVLPVTAHTVYFVSGPSQGIETTPLWEELSILDQISKAGGHLVSSGGGAWVFKWSPPHVNTVHSWNTSCTTLPAWAMASNAGRPLTKGPVANWGMVATGAKGYVLYGGYIRQAAGNYQATVTMASHGPLSVEVWDSDRKELLGKRVVAATGTSTSVVVPYVAPPQLSRPNSIGAGLFRIIPVAAPPNDQIEVRVYSAGHVAAKVTSVQYQDAGAPVPSATAAARSGC